MATFFDSIERDTFRIKSKGYGGIFLQKTVNNF